MVGSRSHLSGEILVALPRGWQIIGYLLFGAALASVLFLSLSSYSRVELASGLIAPAAGVSLVVPTRDGVIANLSVREGQPVTVGTELATILANGVGSVGNSPADRIAAELAKQDASLAEQLNAAQASARAQIAQLGAEQVGLRAEIGQLRLQVGLQKALISSAQNDLDRARGLADRGFVSGRDLRVREEALLVRKQGLAQLEQSLEAKRAASTENEQAMTQSSGQARAQVASLAAARAEVAQRAASAAGARSLVLRAAISGRVTALTAKLGQAVDPGVPVMAILPADAKLRAELAVPNSAIAFVKVGQPVRLAIDAFPFQRYGTVSGRILTVSANPVHSVGPNGGTTLVYPTIVALDADAIRANGRTEPLISGMTLAARIVTGQRSLLEWLFEPLFSVGRR